MATTPLTEALETWLRSHGAYIHPSIRIVSSKEAGIHARATAPIPPGTTIISMPHSLALSPLNALVDDSFPVFRKQKHRFKVEAIGFFYLMSQYINREESFWKPYLDALPSPESEMTQPLFFEELENVAWLQGTDVWFTNLSRVEVYEEYYHDGLEVLKDADIDVRPYTWHLFKWAAAMFTSRSFASRALHSESGKYWSAYKTSASGSRQTIVLDMSRTPAEDLDFPVLFPGLDALNHSHEAHVDWTFDPGQFSITLSGDAGMEAGEEVFNNYGPKSNAELLLGYGFCIPGNLNDSVAMTLKAPPETLQSELRAVQPGYFTNDGTWNSEQSTAYLKAPPVQLDDPAQIFQHLPEPLLELLLYILRYERGLDFTFIQHPLDYLTSPQSQGRRYLPHIARMIMQSLAPKLARLQPITLPSSPQNEKQRQASIYRESQVDILTSLTTALRTYTRSLIRQPRHFQDGIPPTGPCLLTLESFFSLLTTTQTLNADFLRGIMANANTIDIEQLRLAGWEEDVWVLLLCYLFLLPESRRPGWLRGALEQEYSSPNGRNLGHCGNDQDSSEVEQAESLMEIVHTAASACSGDSVWSDSRWTPRFITRTGGKMLLYESFMVMVPGERVAGEGDEVRLCVYLHFGG